MAKRVQRYRLTSTVMATFVGLVGELIVNTSRNSVHVHDGVTEGGFELGRADASNIQNATTGQNGRMTTSHVTQLDAATAGVAANAADIAQEILDRAAADTVLQGQITTNAGNITNLASGKFALNTEPVKLSFYQNTIPTGWTLDTSFDDRVPIVETTQAQGGTTGGSWTISGLTADSHTHAVSGACTVGTPTTTVEVVAGTPGQGAGQSHIHSVTFSVSSGGPTTTGVSSGGGWRPAYVKVLVLTRSTWSA